MPFTGAHPAAVIPLRPLLGRYAVVSALVIGSVMPDLAYILPGRFARGESHSLAGLFWFCLPAGVMSYLAFHLLLKQPLAALLPAAVGTRLGEAVQTKLPAVPWTAVLVSLLVGAATHIVWDAFTHASGFAVRAIPALRISLVAVGNYEVFVYRLLQHGSSLVGLALVAYWLWRWTSGAPLDPRPRQVGWPGHPLLAVSLIALCAAGFGLLSALPALSQPLTGMDVRRFVGLATIASMEAGMTALLAYCALWHLRATRRKRRPIC